MKGIIDLDEQREKQKKERSASASERNEPVSATTKLAINTADKSEHINFFNENIS